jgi:hypothetical protein
MSQTTLGAQPSTPQTTEGPEELSPFWDDRIAHDKTWYSQFVYPESRFYDPHEDSVFRIKDIEHDGKVFTLSPCVKTDGETQIGESPSEIGTNYVDNICSLAGAIEAGDLVHLDTGTLRTVDGKSFLTIGSITIETEEQTEVVDSLLNSFDTPNGPSVTDIAKIESKCGGINPDTTIHVPEFSPATDTEEQASSTKDSWTARNAENLPTYWYDVQPFSKWTFESDEIKEWVEARFEPGETILNACAGKTKLTPPEGGEIIRNDINKDREADYHVDVAELASIPELKKGSIDRIIFDPPWSAYQSNLRYDKNHVYQKEVKDDDIELKETDVDLEKLPFETPDPAEKTQLGHARLAKEGFNWLLKSGGEVMEITQHGSSMPARLDYDRVLRAIFDPLGEGKNVTGSIDKKTRQELTDFL